MVTNDCVIGTIAPFVPSVEKPWDKKRAMHLYRRMGFGATTEQLEEALAQDPSTLVDTLIDEALSLPLSPEPEWANWSENDYTDFDTQREEQLFDWVKQWTRDMFNNGFRDKLTLFWHGHFVTKYETYLCPSYMYAYHKVLQQYAIGDFKEFVKEVGKTPAMLLFLNGIQNSLIEPNENYARELYELFTLGRDNGYTQNDIEETARALTGFNGFFSFCAPISFLPIAHDTGVKTIFDQTGNWGYDDVHDILFNQRGELVANYICGKIYAHFVSPEVDQDIVAELATTFITNEFQLAPVFRQLFKSEHFFDDALIGIQVKPPVDYFLSFIKEGNFNLDEEIEEPVSYFAFLLGQALFSPPDVAGWPGNRAWITNNTITARWQSMDFYLFYLFENTPEAMTNLAKELSNNSIDPEVVTRSLIDYFIPNGLDTEEAYEQATIAFKWEIPQNYFDEQLWNLNWDTIPAQMAFLLQYLNRLPEFQLQ